MAHIFKFLKTVGLSGLLDISLMSVIIYALLVWFKKSKAAFVVIGIIIIGAVYMISRQFNLFLTAAVFQGFFAVILVAVIVIFQEEIKHMFERIAVWSINRGLPRKKMMRMSKNEVETLLRTLTDLARDRIGALIVLRGKDIIVRHLDGGTDLNGEMSEAILKSLFDPHSDGHDGAVIIDRNIITQFAVHLPLSKDLKRLHRTGTRHAAALGLAEVTDALCLVVSEEQGTISVARNGEIEVIADPEKLSLILHRFYEEFYPLNQNAWHGLVTHNFKEKFLAVAITLGLWFVFVFENKLSYVTYTLPIECINLPPQYKLQKISPETADVTFSARRSVFYFVNKNDIHVYMNLLNESEGEYFKDFHRSNLTYPESITFENINPARVKLSILEKAREGSGSRKK